MELEEEVCIFFRLCDRFWGSNIVLVCELSPLSGHLLRRIKGTSDRAYQKRSCCQWGLHFLFFCENNYLTSLSGAPLKGKYQRAAADHNHETRPVIFCFCGFLDVLLQGKKETVALGQYFETSVPIWLLIEIKLLPSAVGKTLSFILYENTDLEFRLQNSAVYAVVFT